MKAPLWNENRSKRVDLGVSTNCSVPITFYSDSNKEYCEPRAGFTVRCRWQPKESDARPEIWSHAAQKTLRILREAVGVDEGYRVASLSRRSLEDMRRRCMVRVTFSRWLFPRRSPSVSAKVEGLNLSRTLAKMEQKYWSYSCRYWAEEVLAADLLMISNIHNCYISVCILSHENDLNLPDNNYNGGFMQPS